MARDPLVTICSSCRQACCVDGVFYCDPSSPVVPGTGWAHIEVPLSTLLQENREHPDWIARRLLEQGEARATVRRLLPGATLPEVG
jgi:hypothetical protein